MHILFVDDETGLQDQAKIYLERLSEDIEVLSTSSAEKALEMIDESKFDVIVSDYRMPGKDGLHFLKEIREERGEDTPFIIFTGQGGEKVAIEALNLGADRYIQKSDDPESQYELLVEAIEEGYEHGKSKKRLKESDQNLRESRKKYQKIFYDSPVGAFHYNGKGTITECNDRFVKIIGSSRKAVIGLDMLNDLDNADLIDEVRSSLEEGEGYYEGEYTSVTGGKTVNVKVFLKGIEDEDGRINSGIGLVEDNTERKEYERELKRKERYLDRTPTYITVIDDEGEMKYHSYPSNKITGLDPSKFMGSEAIDFAHPDDREDVMEMFSEVLENPGEEYSTELRGKVEDGWIWLEITAVNYLDDPEINGIIVSAQDISDRKEIEEELQESEKKFRTVIENSADAIFLTDQEGNYTYANEAASDILGYSREELMEMNIVDLLPDKDVEDGLETFEKMLEEEQVLTEMTLLAKDGTEIPVDLNGVLLPNGKIYGSCRDITERKEAEKELKKQEEKYRSIFEQFQDLYYRTDLEGNIEELSPSVKTLSGYSRDELIGESVSKVYSDPEERAELLNELLEDGEVRGYEIKLEKKSGEIAIASVNSHLIKGEDGDVKGVEGTIRDITEKKKAEEALEREKRRYETLFQQNPESVLEVDEDYKIVKVNERFQDVFSYKEEDILGKNLDDLVVPDDKIEEAEELNKKAKREGYVDHETVRLTKERDEVDVSITARPIEYEGKTRHVVVYRDITERKEAMEREEMLHSLLRHDIKNKAQAVQGFLQLLEEEGELSEDSKELVEGALKANKESVNLIQKVRLLLSAQEEEKMPVEIASTIKDAVESNEAMAIREGIDISLDCPSTGCKVEGGSLLREVFLNIIENSINHSEASKINITGEVEDDEVVCTVEDDGKGIPDDKKDIIFEKGYTTDEERGTGLGLFLVNNLLESYGGNVQVSDSDMGGARFDVRLRRA